jgi:hypothetical protein
MNADAVSGCSNNSVKNFFLKENCTCPKDKDEILGQISDQAIKSMMEENRVFPPSPEFVKNANIKSMDEYKKCTKSHQGTGKILGQDRG